VNGGQILLTLLDLHQFVARGQPGLPSYLESGFTLTVNKATVIFLQIPSLRAALT
jgi:hypothetical protein